MFILRKIADRKKADGLGIRSVLTAFPNVFKANVKKACFILVISISILSIMNCEIMGDIFGTDPEDLEYDTHVLTLHVKAINHSKDSLGVKQAVLPLYEYSYERPFNPPQDDNIFFTEFPDTLYIKIPPTDTEVYIYETKINHYIGYKEEHGGDATRYSCLDRYEGWHMELFFSEGNVVLDSGDSLKTHLFWTIIPDYVSVNKRLDIEIIFDLNGLFYSNYSENLWVDESKISSRQM